MSIFKDCDIRGVYDKELFDADGYRVGRELVADDDVVEGQRC